MRASRKEQRLGKAMSPAQQVIVSRRKPSVSRIANGLPIEILNTPLLLQVRVAVPRFSLQSPAVLRRTSSATSSKRRDA